MAAGEGQDSGNDDFRPLASEDASAAFGAVAAEDSTDGMGGQSPAVLPVAEVGNSSSEVQKLFKSERITAERAEAEAARLAAEREANRPKFVKPAEGNFTSGFGGRWGGTHYGIDLANSIGTPILAAADGQVIEAGYASGFGQWVRIQHDDGTVTVYGHVEEYYVAEGEWVKAGEEIAAMGNEGFSTGPHLHFEVWDASGMKTNPTSWFAEHGISLY